MAARTAAERLKAWREAKKLNRLQVARILGVDWGALRDWEDGTSAPSLKSAVAIEARTGIPARAWVA